MLSPGAVCSYLRHLRPFLLYQFKTYIWPGGRGYNAARGLIFLHLQFAFFLLKNTWKPNILDFLLFKGGKCQTSNQEKLRRNSLLFWKKASYDTMYKFQKYFFEKCLKFGTLFCVVFHVIYCLFSFLLLYHYQSSKLQKIPRLRLKIHGAFQHKNIYT